MPRSFEAEFEYAQQKFLFNLHDKWRFSVCKSATLDGTQLVCVQF